MKKIYTMLTAALFGVASMSAVQLTPVAGLSSSVKSEKQTAVIGTVSDIALNPGAELRPAPPSSGGDTKVEDYNGTYTWTGSWLLNGTAPGAIDFVISVDNATGAATIAGLPQGFVLKATFDFAKNTLTIPNMQDLGEDNEGYPTWFYLKEANDQGQVLSGASNAEATVGTISGATIVFPTMDIWAIGDPSQENLGYWWMSYRNRLELQLPDDPNVDPDEGWTAVGNATFSDGWVLPLFGADQTSPEYMWEVPLQQKDADHNVYRLVNPYKGNSPLASVNESTVKRGYIQFDVTDPNQVLFEAVEAGFAFSQAGVTGMYCLNEMSTVMGSLNYTVDEALQAAAAQGVTITATTFKDGVVSLGSTLNADGSYTNNACFGMPGNIYAGYGWSDKENKSINMACKIIFPNGGEGGVEGVVAEKVNNAPVEYFNLQGVRVMNPEAGQLVIKRQGNEVKKVVIR